MTSPALKHAHAVLLAALCAGCGDAPEPPPLAPAHGPLDALHTYGLIAAGHTPACVGSPIRNHDGSPTGQVRCDDGGVDLVGERRCLDTPTLDAERGETSGQCDIDADCVNGQICLCQGADLGHQRGVCTWVDCTGPSDCGGSRCGIGEQPPSYYGSPFEQAYCRTPDDVCAGDAGCPDFGDLRGKCFAPDELEDGSLGSWSCGLDAVVYYGRPLRVAARPRLAPGDRRGDWQATAPRLRPDATLAAHWSTIAALEHASVASFARFSMQLMALGAPADLLADCQRAAADEVEHARMAYAIASAFAGDAIGPGPLSLDGITLDADPASVLREVILEGCIGETLAAVEAAEAARAVEDPVIAAACARIAEDELRHAALGWRTARWLLACHPELTAMACAAFVNGIRQAIDGITPSPDAITRQGIATRPALRRAACADVIVPLAERLLAKGLTT